MPTEPQPFSIRTGVRPPIPTRDAADLPESARAAVFRIIDQERQGLLPGTYSLAPRIAAAAGRLPSGPGDIQGISRLLRECEWRQFYDVAEELLRITGKPDELAALLDGAFAAEGLPYRVTEEGISWRHSELAEDALQVATRSLSSDPRFEGPLDQFEKARQHLNSRPPDTHNCVKDALGALEGVARVVVGSTGTLGQLTRPLRDDLRVHPALANAISSLYGYRGDEQGVGHGATEALQPIPAEAELVLHWAGAAISYLIAKFENAQT